MTWIKVEADMPSHLKIQDAGLEAMGLWVAGLCFCAKYRTDGRIDKDRLEFVWPCVVNSDGLLVVDRRQTLLGIARRLVQVKLWDDKGAYWRVHDYLEYQESRREIDQKRLSARERQRAHRQKYLPRIPELPQHLSTTPVTPSVTRDSAVSHKKKGAILPGRVGSDRDGSGSGEDPGSPILGGGGPGEGRSNGHAETPGYPAEAVDRVIARYEEFARPIVPRLRRATRLDEDCVVEALRSRSEEDILEALRVQRDLTVRGDDKTWTVPNFRIEVLMRQTNLDRALGTLPAPAEPKHAVVRGEQRYNCTCLIGQDHAEDPAWTEYEFRDWQRAQRRKATS